MKAKKIISVVLSGLLCFFTPFMDMSTVKAQEIEKDVIFEEVSKETLFVDLKAGQDEEDEFLSEEAIGPDEMVRVLIMMEGDSILDQNSDATAGVLTNVQSRVMELLQNRVVSKIENQVLEGDELEIRYHYSWLLNAVATEVPYGMIEEIEQVKGVSRVIVQPVYEVYENEASKKDADIYTVTDGVMIGREDTWTAGYTGQGMKICIIDTGIDDDHQSFQAMSSEKLTDASATEADIAAVLSQTNAAKMMNGLSVSDVYRSNKIVYGFNYVDENLVIDHSRDSQGDHGTHVAGIAAANKIDTTEVVGVAPDAQLYVMKVFGANGGAYTDDLLAAVEDAVILGVDVINMSLGSPAGFTSASDEIDAIYSKVKDTKTVLAVAAGNSTTSGYNNLWGNGTNLASNPDNGIVSSPATYVSATSVASVDNVGYMSSYVTAGDHKIGYTEGQEGPAPLFASLAGNSFSFAMVDNKGQSLEDFEAADVEGKIAVVQRGITSFVSKIEFAEQAGAIACLIYNNTSGTMSMDLSTGSMTIPAASITMKDGELLSALKEQGISAINCEEGMAVISSETGYQVSDFSSWGVTGDLQIEPEIAAPGGNIYSTLNNGEYGLMSGTSMASPNLAGVAAVVSQYVQAQYPYMQGSHIHRFVNALLVSTSVPLAYDEEVTFSPRAQGSGLANAYNAITTKAYLSVDGSDTPKATLGDDPLKTGAYGFDYQVTNFGDEDLYFIPDTTAQTEDVFYDEELDKLFMATTPVALSAVTDESSSELSDLFDNDQNGEVDTKDARNLYLMLKNEEVFGKNSFLYDVNADEEVSYADVQEYLDQLVGKDSSGLSLDTKVLKVSANSTVPVHVSIQVSEADKAYMDASFENGIYVEGFSYLKSLTDGGVDLSLPYVGFYGDWTQAPILDSGYYYEDERTVEASQYYNILYTAYGNNTWLLGLNPYVDENEIHSDYVSLTSADNGFLDGVYVAYLSLLRNAARIEAYAVDSSTGEIYYEVSEDNINKSYYSAAYGMCIPYVFRPDQYFACTDKDGNALSNGTELDFVFSASLDYTRHESHNVSDTWTTHITIDNEAPVVSDADISIDEETGKQYLTLTFSDNVQVAAMNFVDEKGRNILAQMPVEHVGRGEETTQTFDVTGFGNSFMVIPGDYAGNEAVYLLTTTENDPVLETEYLYGYRIADTTITDDSLFGWVAFDPVSEEVIPLSSEASMDYAIASAEYVDGYIIAIEAVSNKMVSIIPGRWYDRQEIATIDSLVTIVDLAFDADNGILYGYDSMNSQLVTVDLADGTITPIGDLYSLSSVNAITFANGYLYGMNSEGYLAKISTENGTWDDETVISIPDYAAYNNLSMTYNEEDGCIYYSFYSFTWMGTSVSMVKCDLANGEVTEMDTTARLAGMFDANKGTFTLDREAELTEIELSRDQKKMILGDIYELEYKTTPWYATVGELTFTSEDTDVVSVNHFGELTAVGVGETIVTVKTSNGISDSIQIEVVNPQASLTGFVLATVGQKFDNQWVSFDSDALENAVALSETMDEVFYCGEYVNGTIYAFNATGSFYEIDPSTYEYEKLGENKSGYYPSDMAYDYSSGMMYALVTDAFGMTSLATVDLLTGEFELLGQIAGNDNDAGCAISCSLDGTLYVITVNGLYTCDKEYASLSLIGKTGFSAISTVVQTMAFDHENNDLYWAMLTQDYRAEMMYVDLESGEAIPLGGIDNGAQMTSLFVIPEHEIEVPYVAVEGLRAKSEKLSLVEGGRASLGVTAYPVNATNREIIWTIADETVARIENGQVIGVSEGATTAYGVCTDKEQTFEITLSITVPKAAGDLYGFAYVNLNSEAEKFFIRTNDTDVNEMSQLSDVSDYWIYAGEYYNGKIYAYGTDSLEGSAVYMVIDADTYAVEEVYDRNADIDVFDLAFDYSTGAMYAVAGRRNIDANSTLYGVNLSDGTLYSLGEMTAQVQNMACSTDGHLYGIDNFGAFYEIDKLNGSLSYIGETGSNSRAYSAMAFDHNTGNLYWAQWYLDEMTYSYVNALMLVDKETGAAVSIGKIGGDGVELTAMYTIPENLTAVSGVVSNLILSKDTMVMKVNEEVSLSVTTFPGVSEEVMTFTSSDENIVTVSPNGTVTAVGTGSAVITVSCQQAVAFCTVTVVEKFDSLYIWNEAGYEKATEDLTDKEETAFVETVGMMNHAAYLDGSFYVMNRESKLYQMSADMSEVSEIGTIVADNAWSYDVINLLDLEANPFDSKLYAIAEAYSADSIFIDYYLYEIDVTNASANMVAMVPFDIGAPGAFTFVSEDTMILYDGYCDEIFKVTLEYDFMGAFMSCEKICASYPALVASDERQMSMTYDSLRNVVYVLAYNNDYFGSGETYQALYAYDVATHAFSMICRTAWNDTFADIFFIREAQEAAVLSLEAQDLDETEESDEVFETETEEICLEAEETVTGESEIKNEEDESEIPETENETEQPEVEESTETVAEETQNSEQQ